MSFINKLGKTRAKRKMIVRQQVTDVLAYGQIITTHTKAKETQRHVDRIITLAKKNTLASRRSAAAIGRRIDGIFGRTEGNEGYVRQRFCIRGKDGIHRMPRNFTALERRRI